MNHLKQSLTIILCFILVLNLIGCSNPLLDDDNSGSESSASSVKEETNHDTHNSTETGIDLYGIYDQNDLIIDTLEEKYKDITLEIPQMKGLKDHKIQEKMNQEIYQSVMNAVNEMPEVINASHYTYSNFANVISLQVYIANNETSKQLYFNYDLTSGEQLRLEDLFLKDTDLLEIIREAFYKTLVQFHMMDGMDGEIVSHDENELYRIVKRYSQKEDKTFAFSPSDIYLYYKDYVASVSMKDYADQIGIYSRYLTKDSLFERNDIGKKNIFTCASFPDNTFKIFEFGYLEDNLWYDVTVFNQMPDETIGREKREKFAQFEENIYHHVFNQIEEYRKTARDNPDRFFIFLAKPNVYIESDSIWNGEFWDTVYTNRACVNENIQIFEMPGTMFDSTYKDKLIDAYRYRYFALQGGVYLDPDVEQNVILTENREEQIITFMDEQYEKGELHEKSYSIFKHCCYHAYDVGMCE